MAFAENFHLSRLSNLALRKIFCASEYLIERLVVSETGRGDY